eukprot:jgi/Phyca11/101588/e_gw1.5.1237.1
MTQRFTLAYRPWINGSIERLNRDILQVLRSLLPLIQANLNHSPVASLANHAPAEVFLGVKAATPLQKVHTKRNKSNQRGAQPVNFHVGDYVLWSRIDSKMKTNKLAVKWNGPYHVTNANANSFEVEQLLTGSTHALRLKLYADSSLDVNK